MGKPIVYCGGCGESLREADFEKGRAHLLEGQPYCTRCRPLPAGAAPATPVKPPTTKIPLPSPTPRKTTTAHIPLARAPQTTRRARTDGTGRRAFIMATGAIGALFLVIAAAVTSGGRDRKTGRRTIGVEATPVPAAAPAIPRPPEIRPDPPPERLRPTPPAPAPALTPEETLRQLEALAASSPDPDDLILRCESALSALRGKPEEARAREIENAAREKKKERDRQRQVDSALDQARQIRGSDPKFERKEEILNILRSTAEIAGPRRPEVEAALADYEAAVRAAESTAATHQKPGPPSETPRPPAPPAEILPEIKSFTLINADTDRPIPAFDPIPEGAILNLAALPTRNLNVRANTSPGKVGSVKFLLDGVAVPNIEDEEPYALAGNEGADYKSWVPSPGDHTVTAVPYTWSKADGKEGKGLTVSFTVVDKPGNRPPEVRWKNPANRASIAVPAQIPLTAEAVDPDGRVLRVEFYRGATRLGAADAGPYTFPWAAYQPGNYELTARACDDAGGVGASTPLQLVLKPGGRMKMSLQDGVAPDPSYTGTSDAAISESNPDRIQGTSAVCEIDGDSGKDGKGECALLRWDLSSIPAGARILAASISLYLTEKGSKSPYGIYAMRRGWSETEVTWNSPAAGMAWEVPGAKGLRDRGTELLAQLPNRERGEVTVPLNPAGVALVQSWVDSHAANHGVIIAGPDIKEGTAFVSREGTPPERRPKLTIVLGAGTRLVHYEGFDKGPGKFKGGEVVEEGMNGTAALSVPPSGAWIEDIPWISTATPIPQKGFQLWLMADAGVTVDGPGVSQWADQSGNGRHAVQAAAEGRPALVGAALNGKPAVQFDGVDDFMTFTMPVNGLSEMTVVLVASCLRDSAGGKCNAENAAIFWDETAYWGTVYLSPFQTNVKYRFGTRRTENLPSYARPASVGDAFSITMSMKNGPVESLFVNGQRVMGETGKQTAIQACTDQGNLGRGCSDRRALKVRKKEDEWTFFQGRLAEVIVYNRALPDTERKGLEQYLQNKYFSLSGPSSNPKIRFWARPPEGIEEIEIVVGGQNEGTVLPVKGLRPGQWNLVNLTQAGGWGVPPQHLKIRFNASDASAHLLLDEFEALE